MKIEITKRAFTLIEFMIYMMLILFIILWFDQLRVHIVESATSQLKKITYHYQILSALDLISKDIGQAPCDQKQWVNTQSNKLMWKKDKNNVGWLIKNNNLYKLSSINAQSDHKSHYSLILKKIDDSRFELVIENGIVKGVRVLLRYHSLELQRLICLKSGIHNESQ